MNPHEMTADECREWLAEDDGLLLVCRGMPEEGFITANGREVDHPYPPTLDAAAKAFTCDWNVRIEYQKARKDQWLIHYWEPLGAFPAIRRITAPDELTARYRLAVACRLANKEKK